MTALHLVSICAASAALASMSVRADSVPKPQALARYEPMMNDSLFRPGTLPVPSPPEALNSATDLYIASAANLADECVVTLALRRDRSFAEYLSTKRPSESGFKILKIEWSDCVGRRNVTNTDEREGAPGNENNRSD